MFKHILVPTDGSELSQKAVKFALVKNTENKAFTLEEYEAHVKQKKCPSKQCKDLISFSILTDNCTGCTLCFRNCPVEAISGEKGKVHNIDQDKCIKCGICFSKCKYEAILVE